MENKAIETNYSIVAERTPDIIALEINTIKDQTAKIIISNSIEIGRKLTEAKSMLQHGEWGDWLKEKVNYSQDTAGNLMKIFDEYGADQIDLFGTANSETFRNLGYSQAVALLAVPKDEREDFVDAVDAENLSVRELKEKIKEYEDGKAALEQRAQEAENEKAYFEKKAKDREEIIREKELQIIEKEEEVARLEKEVKKAEDIAEIASKAAIDKMKKEDPEAFEENETSDEEDESEEAFDQYVEEMENLEKELEAKKAELEALKADQETRIEEARRQAAKDAEEKLGFKSNKDVIKFSVIVEELQKKYNEAIEVLTPIMQNDPEQGGKLTNALRQILNRYLEWLEE